MSFIYSFLQKRRMHESQHGYLLVFAAYILSAFMLLVGSDLFYNINSAAADTNVDTKEETQDTVNGNLNGLNYNIFTTQLTARGLVNPYGLEDTATQEDDTNTTDSLSADTDTVWLLGAAMDDDTFDTVMKEVGTIKHDEKKDKTPKKSPKITAVVKSEYGNIAVKDVQMLERIVQAEAGGEDMIGKVLIANVIMNRVESRRFPNSIKGVIFQQKNGSYQFSPVGNGRYWSVSISKQTKEAVKKALSGVDYSKGALYFVARRRANPNSMRWFDNKLDWLFKHGGHEFYKNK
jgi:N-acetylmuramoyl-L-alanine amidase